MYQVNIHLVDGSLDRSSIVKAKDCFFLSNSDEVCELITKLPKKYFVSLIEFDFDDVSSVLKSFGLNGSSNL